MQGSIVLEGWEEVANSLWKVPKAEGKKIMRKATRAGAKITLQFLKQNCPANWASHFKIKSKGGNIQVTIGEGAYMGETFYLSFVEWGYQKRQAILIDGEWKTLKTGKKKKVEGKHYIRDAAIKSEPTAIAAIKEAFANEFEKAGI